jgi:hypothetical protein
VNANCSMFITLSRWSVANFAFDSEIFMAVSDSLIRVCRNTLFCNNKVVCIFVGE